MNMREVIVQGLLAAIAVGALGFVLSVNQSDERKQYRDRCACENCRCRCHIEGGTP